ncbi:hypothetical protein [Ahrensia sp. R2A130]|uniref:hypothetical protein n=1 Tax=Ahrensia sp. R2A130 TaxID=744979 RepID=UPI0001E0E89D|nr:hypothetical protein [Ahrensia sp. R2A130]EFL89355.1 conserved hypothetical protein [Ahrensia sp. R2A130]
MSRDLRKAQSGLDTITGATLAILALASGVYTYLGVRDLLNGSPTVVFLGAIIYSVAVSVGIFGFWSYLMRFMPHIRTPSARRWLYLAMALGSAMIIAMSSWLNAAALAGGAALEQHLANTTEQYQQKLEQAHDNALAAQSLLPDIELASQRFERLSAEEASTGALTGTSGSGTVVQLLSQMSRQLQGLSAEIVQSRVPTKELFEEGGKRLAAMRKLVSQPGPVDIRANAFAEEAVALSGTIAALQQTSIAPAVRRAADDLGRSFIAPVADGSTADLASRQTDVVSRVEQSVKDQSAALSAAADEILQRPPVVQVRFVPLSSPEAVLRYAKDFLPSWAGAISIDLLPAVMIFILCIVQGAIRSEEGADLGGDEVTASEMMRAVRLYKELNALDAPTSSPAAPPPDDGPAPNVAPDSDGSNVTPLSHKA